jgi:hypothetical protein
MRVKLRKSAGEVEATLEAADDFTAFSLEIGPEVPLAPVPGKVRFTSGTRALVDQRWLVETGGFGSGPAAESFAAMLAYAEKKGWVDAETGEIAAHVTHPPSRPEEGR